MLFGKKDSSGGRGNQENNLGEEEGENAFCGWRE